MGVVKDAAKVTGGTLAAGAVAMVVIIALAVMWIFGWGFMSQVTAPWRGETEKRELVEASGAYRIAAYDHFFDLCTTIQGQEATITSLEEELNSPVTSDARKEQVTATLTTLQAQRVTNIAQYNNDGAKDYTAGQFRDSDLPYPLNANQEKTTCTH